MSFTFTAFRSRSPLTKTLSLDGKGKLVKAPPSHPGSGTAKRFSLPSLSELPAFIARLSRNECLIHGVCADKEIDIAPQDYPREGAISRTKENFPYPDGSALVVIDHDPDGVGIYYSPQNLIEILSGILPEIGRAARVVKLSTSAEIYTKEGRKVSTNNPGYHIYFLAECGSDISRFGKVLFDRLWLAGFGHCRFSKAGSILQRGPIDEAVFSPERLDFVAGADLKDGLEQQIGSAEYASGNETIDTKLLLDLVDDEKKRLNQLRTAEADRLKPRQESVRRAYAVEQSQTTGETVEAILKGLRSFDKGKISADYVATLPDGQKITLQDLISEGNNAYILDPLEPDRARARVYIDDGSATVWSFLHGGKSWRVVPKLHPQLSDVERYCAIPSCYPEPSGTFDDAVKEMEQFVDDFIMDTVAFNRQGPKPKSEFNDITKPYMERPVWFLKCLPGLGKSHSARGAVIKILKECPGQSVAMTVPRHNLADEQAQKFKEKYGTDFTVDVYRGRGADNPDAPTGDEKNPFEKMCLFHVNAAALGSIGGDVQGLMCHNKKTEIKCIHFDNCGYQAQKNKKRDLWFVPHNLLVSEKPDCIGNLAAVIIDEDPSNAFLQGFDDNNPTKVTINDLNRIKRKFAADKNGFRTSLNKLTEFLSGLNDGTISVSDLKKGGYSHIELNALNKSLWGAKNKIPISPVMDQARQPGVGKEEEIHQVLYNIIRFVEILNDAIEQDSNIVPGVRLSNGTLTLKWKEKVAEGWKVPTLIMDATGNKEILSRFFPDLSKSKDINCAMPYVRATQVTDWNGSRNKLVSNGKNDVTASNNADRLARTIEVLAAQYRGKGKGKYDVAVVTYKDTCAALKEKISANVKTVHFGGLTGLDGMRGVACLIIAGWDAKGVSDVEARAEVIKGDRLEPLSSAYGDWYAKETVGGTSRGKKSGLPLVRIYHNDPMAEAVRWQMQEGELIQAIGRGRGVRRKEDNPLHICILANVPLPIAVDEFVDWEDIQPTYNDLLAARGIVIDAVPSRKGYCKLVAALLPDLFSKPRAVSEHINSRNTLTYGFAYSILLISKSVREEDIFDLKSPVNELNLPSAQDFRADGWHKVTVTIGRYGIPIWFSERCDLLKVFGPDVEFDLEINPETGREYLFESLIE